MLLRVYGLIYSVFNVQLSKGLILFQTFFKSKCDFLV
nr:MAG TPA: hypothetical protein [Caudoviricetes sp.]